MCTKKIAQKLCPGQLKIDLFTKNLKSSWLCSCQMIRGVPITVILWKENKNLQNWSNMQKSGIFYENWLYQEQRPLEEKKTV